MHIEEVVSELESDEQILIRRGSIGTIVRVEKGPVSKRTSQSWEIDQEFLTNSSLSCVISDLLQHLRTLVVLLVFALTGFAEEPSDFKFYEHPGVDSPGTAGKLPRDPYIDLKLSFFTNGKNLAPQSFEYDEKNLWVKVKDGIWKGKNQMERKRLAVFIWQTWWMLRERPKDAVLFVVSEKTSETLGKVEAFSCWVGDYR